MDLNLKKYLKFEVLNDEKGKELINIIPDKTISTDGLKADEKRIFEFVKAATEDKEKISVKELEKHIKKNYTSVNKLITDVVDDEKKFLKNEGYTDEKEISKYNKLVLIAILPTFALFFFALMSFIFAFEDSFPEVIGIGVFVFFVLAVGSWILSSKACHTINQHTQKGVDEINKWEAFKKFMKDFSMMDQKELPAIVVWEHFLVYATAFGMADEVIKQLKVKYPEMNNNEYFDHYSTMYLVSHTNFSKGINEIKNKTAKPKKIHLIEAKNSIILPCSGYNVTTDKKSTGNATREKSDKKKRILRLRRTVSLIDLIASSAYLRFVNISFLACS